LADEKKTKIDDLSPKTKNGESPDNSGEHGGLKNESMQEGHEYEIPVEGEEIDKLISHYESEHSKTRAHKKKKKKSIKEPGPSREFTQKELLSHLQEKNKLLFALKKNNSNIKLELKSLKDKWLRAAADFENYKKRSRKEWELLQHKTKADVFLEILNIVDDFERAFSAAERSDDEFVKGIQLIYQNLLNTLTRFGIKPIEAVDQRFDPKYHMAVGQIEAKGKKSGHVVEVTQRGYFLNEIVLRPAKVIIAK